MILFLISTIMVQQACLGLFSCLCPYSSYVPTTGGDSFGNGGGGGAMLPKKYGCFGPTSTVETKDGVKTIRELIIGDEIRTSEDNLDNTGFTEVSCILINTSYIIYIPVSWMVR